MLRYIFLCLLIAPQVFGDCDYKWFKCRNTTTPLDCKLEVNEGWIKNSKSCDGIKHCADGSDEALVNCKMRPENYLPHAYDCASGGTIHRNNRCDNNTNCWDNSDELRCNNQTETSVDPRGQCGEAELECLPGECISASLWCNNKIDCSNGRDESMEQCFTICNKNEFRCGYGTCIRQDQLCDNRTDCLDGADELSNICNGTEPYINCTEPQLGVLSPIFADDTEYQIYQHHKYVWPNSPVHFRCPEETTLGGLEWNVCQIDGSWHHELPICTIIEYE